MHGHTIEARLAMEAGRLRQSISDIERHAGIDIPEEPRLVLVHDFEPLAGGQEIMGVIREISRGRDDLGFVIDGFGMEEEGRGHVLSFRVVPDPGLEAFRCDLYRSIRHMIREGDAARARNEDFVFRAVIASGLGGAAAGAARSATGLPGAPGGGQRPVRRITFPSEAVLITMTDRGRIRAEYDILNDRILDGRQALSGSARYDMLAAYRRMRGIEVPPGRQMPGRTWVTSDTHFDHANI
ncbi:MAG: hypothetical protein MPK75_13140, partial [Alphaproteobacteria bacterium]|nr:hypothetical protein [Alphaproteobacteria bacterium]